MERAQRNDAARREKFFFRQNITTSASPQCCAELYDHILPQQPNDAQVNGGSNSTEAASTPGKKHEGGCCPPMTLDAIINGQAGVFPGLIPLVRRYLDSVEVGVQARCSIQEYLNLISKRASGEYLTTAQWIREFVRSHPDYKFDSVVNDTIAYDLLVQCNKLTGSHRDDQPEPNDGPQLFGHTRHKSEYVAGKKIDDVTS